MKSAYRTLAACILLLGMGLPGTAQKQFNIKGTWIEGVNISEKSDEADRNVQRSEGANTPSEPPATFWSRGQSRAKSAEARMAMSSSVA